MSAQPLDSLVFRSLEPLTDCSFTHSSSGCDVFLLPALLMEFPGSSSASFFPIEVVFLLFHPSTLPCLALFAKVNN